MCAFVLHLGTDQTTIAATDNEIVGRVAFAFADVGRRSWTGTGGAAIRTALGGNVHITNVAIHIGLTAAAPKIRFGGGIRDTLGNSEVGKAAVVGALAAF